MKFNSDPRFLNKAINRLLDNKINSAPIRDAAIARYTKGMDLLLKNESFISNSNGFKKIYALYLAGDTDSLENLLIDENFLITEVVSAKQKIILEERKMIKILSKKATPTRYEFLGIKTHFEFLTAIKKAIALVEINRKLGRGKTSDTSDTQKLSIPEIALRQFFIFKYEKGKEITKGNANTFLDGTGFISTKKLIDCFNDYKNDTNRLGFNSQNRTDTKLLNQQKDRYKNILPTLQPAHQPAYLEAEKEYNKLKEK